MGADAFVAFYGIKVVLDPNDEDMLDAVGDDSDPRCQRALTFGLHTHAGRMTEGEDYFLFIGRRLGWLGLEHASHVQVDMHHLSDLHALVRAKLIEAGFSGTPALHLQLTAQY
jgi:hypothetical protein